MVQTIRTEREKKFIHFINWGHGGFDRLANDLYAIETDSPHLYGGDDFKAYKTTLRNDFNTWVIDNTTYEVNGKKPVVNGGINTSLTVDELICFDVATKIRLIHSLQVSGEFLHSYQGVKGEAFTKLEKIYEIDDLIEKATEQEINFAIYKLVSRFKAHEAEMQKLTAKIDFKRGEMICDFFKTNHIKAETHFNVNELCGYIQGIGQWNEFEPAKIIPILQLFDKTFPRKDYGINNPNTGALCHSFSIKNDYIFLNVDYCNSNQLEAFKTWYNDVATRNQKKLQADSMRIEIGEFGNNAHSFTLVMWWD